MLGALLRSAAVALTAVSIAGCLKPMEPTLASSEVFIDPAGAAGVELDRTRIINAQFRIRNTGTRSITVDAEYRRLEKLVNQEWRLVDEVGIQSRQWTINLSPNQSALLQYSVVYDPSAGIQPLLEHVRGVYRARFRLSFSRDGSEMLPDEESYSRPFSVTCC